MSDPIKLPVFVPVTTRIAACLGIIQAVIGIALNSVAMHMYLHGCESLTSDTDTDTINIFGRLLHQYFFINEDCDASFVPIEIRISEAVTPSQIFTWAAVGVSFSAVWLITSITVLLYVEDRKIKSVNLVLYTWCINTLCITVIDLTLGILFGISFQEFTDAMLTSSALPEDATNLNPLLFPALEFLRLAALLLMSISLRGFVMFIINLVFVGILFWHTYEIHQILKTQEHSIHSRQPINAFASNKPGHNNMWQFNSSEFDPAAHSGSGSNIQRGFRPEHDDRSTWRSNIDRELANSRQSESNSWRPKEHSNMAARPFSYLEEPRPVRHPNPVPSPTIPNPMSPPWKRNSNWESNVVHVPAPDYSPLQNRKLKSALKPGYNY